MRKTALLLLVAVICQNYAYAAEPASESKYTQDVRQALKEDPTRASVQTRNYEFFPDARMTAAPSGYKPFYILQYARHGARTDGSVKNAESMLNKLELIRNTDPTLWKPAADTLYSEARAMYEMTNGYDGVLVPSGQKEHEQLAVRLYERYGKVFKDGAADGRIVRVKSTTSPRVLLSMAAYTNSLTRLVPGLTYRMSSSPAETKLISHGPSDKIKDAAKHLRDSLCKVNYDQMYLMRRLFTDPERAAQLVDVGRFEKNLYFLARFSKPLEREVDLYNYLSDDAIYRYWLTQAAELYLYNGNSVELGAERMQRCQRLVNLVLDSAKEAISGSEICADLIFGHDYPLVALCSRFHIVGVGEQLSAGEIASRWIDPTNISFASNLQMVFFRNKNGSVLVKFIYNDRERQIDGLESVGGCFYRWEDVQTLRHY